MSFNLSYRIIDAQRFELHCPTEVELYAVERWLRINSASCILDIYRPGYWIVTVPNLDLSRHFRVWLSGNGVRVKEFSYHPYGFWDIDDDAA